MKPRATIFFGLRRLAWARIIGALAFLPAITAFAQEDLDESWTVMVNGQVVPVDTNGTFSIPNISAPDFFGPGGPGTPPDFRGDDFIRVIGISTKGGTNRYAFSEYFQIFRGGIYSITNLTITDVPPRKPQSLRALNDRPTLTSIGQSTQLRVLAQYWDGTSSDVAPRRQWTIYRNSNPRIASISNDGLVTALTRGMVFITAVNEGATTVAQIDVSPGDPLTEISGFVHDTNGLPVAGISVKVVGAAGETVTSADGSFRIPGVATSFGIQAVIAYGTTVGTLFGIARDLRVIPGGITDAGIIIAESLCTTCPDADGDRLPDSLELVLGTDRTKQDTDGDGLSDYDEIFIHGTDPLNPDTDSDGLNDRDEIFVANTNPFKPDTDGDGWFDGDEVADGTDPLDSNSHPSQTFLAYPPLQIDLPSSETFGNAGAPAFVAQPPLQVDLPSPDSFGSAGAAIFVARPPVEICLPSADSFGSAGAAIFVALPPLQIDLPSSDSFGSLGAAIFVAEPPLRISNTNSPASSP